MEKIIIQENTFEKARNKIKSSKSKKVIFSSNDDELNRKVLEKLPIQILLLNVSGKKDKQKQRDSGFNQVLAKIAKKKEIEIGINLDEIIEAKTPIEKAKILSRIRQNIKLCNKNKIRMKFISPSEKSRNLHDLKALGLVLGMPTPMLNQRDID